MFSWYNFFFLDAYELSPILSSTFLRNISAKMSHPAETKTHCPPQIKWAKNKPQRSHVTSTIENVYCEHHRRHSPTWVCGRNSNQRQDFQGEAGWPRNVLWFASQVSLFQLSEGKRRKLDTAGGKSPDKIGLHPTEGVLFFITGMQCFLGGLGKSSTESTELIKSPVCVITQWL